MGRLRHSDTPAAPRNYEQQLVLVYCGDGAGPSIVRHTLSTLRQLLDHSRYSIETTTADFLRDSLDWEARTALLVMPGGRDLPYLRDLSATTTTTAATATTTTAAHSAHRMHPHSRHRRSAAARIRSFVEAHGGRYLGICAGGYFASRKVEFEMGTAQEVVGMRPLEFFPGVCRGSVYGGYDWRSEAGARDVVLEVESSMPADQARQRRQLVRCYFNGGGWFVDAAKMAHENVSVWAHYPASPASPASPFAVREERRAAVVARRFPDSGGIAVMMGVHPEVDPALMDPLFYPGEGQRDMIRRLVAADKARRRFMASVFERMGLVCNASGINGIISGSGQCSKPIQSFL
ncbi:hypothetical protein GQ42DRAFT_162333 [Ramicandelaber brevisporus]|nr:hypothetical protein GQ42DRAFT_162333 [Ramicandelaber brevisporus]